MSDRRLPEIYDSIIFGSAETDDDRASGRTRIGGRWAEPDLALSYLLAARKAMDGAAESGLRLERVAAPVAYLQRHAYELALKDLIGCANQLFRERVYLKNLKKHGLNAKYTKPDAPPKTHSLRRLIKALHAALDALRPGRKSKKDPPPDNPFDPKGLPTTIEAMATRLAELEKTEARFRYGPFPEHVVLELRKTQEDLEALLAEQFWCRDFSHAADTDTIYAGMAMDSNAIAMEAHEIERGLEAQAEARRARKQRRAGER